MSFHIVAHWCDFVLDFSKLGDLILCLVQHSASRRGASTLLLRLSPLTSRSPSIFSSLSYVFLCRGVDDVRVRNQWGALDGLTALLSGIHWGVCDVRGILCLGRALRAHWVDEAWSYQLSELLMIWTTGVELREFLSRIVT